MIPGTRSRKVLAVAVILVVAVILAVVYFRAKKPVAKTSVTPQGSTSTKDTSVHAGPAHDSTPSPTVLPSNPSHPATTSLPKPIGPNDNVRSVSLSGGHTMMDSTCATVAGASCYIQASGNGLVVTVSQTKTIGSDAQGVELTWDASQLAPGTWSIQAVATKDGQKALSDSQTLTVTN